MTQRANRRFAVLMAVAAAASAMGATGASAGTRQPASTRTVYSSSACPMEVKAAQKKDLDPDCSVGTSANTIRLALALSASKKIGYAAYQYVMNHTFDLVHAAKKKYRCCRGWIKNRIGKGRDIIGKGADTVKKAGTRFGHWIEHHGFTTGFLRDHLKPIARECGKGGIAGYLLVRFAHGKSKKEALESGALDGCVGGAAIYLLG